MSDGSSPDEPLPTRTEAGEATLDLPEGLGFFSTGQVLGDRYEILEMLGRGGMGEVWRAFDLKLRVEVGLKALREELFQSEGRREMLRQEVRAAREVISPNVCRIFDLIEIDGRELVSMEYVDGATLLGVLQERGPLELKEAQDIASQFLAGLEAIHKAGLVHRDVKPENIMLTRAGRVVVMDFGLARGPESGAGSVSGTPAYMAPEHAAGQDVDARADVYSAGVVLAEMVSPDGIKSYKSRQSVWEGVRSEPAQVPDSPWAPVIQRAVARDRERRQNSAHTLIRELEDVTLRVEGADDLHPYPGLASFTEEDAEYFFGREAEVERMWRKLAGPPRLVGIMGPSGAGKTSFIRAGLTPNAPSGWKILRCTPGNAAIASLRSALTPELTHRPELLQALMAEPDNENVIVDAVAAWREDHTGALLIVDQFEELFTLNSRQDQQRFSGLLGRLPLEDDVHVIASMRDDFAVACNTHQALQPIFSELTVLNPPTGGHLRRALVHPATRCGYRFEDDELVEQILAEVEGERGALPLVAFALARLWEKRDRETGLLTRQAYHDIGGVGGALARHAEATIDRIGVKRIPIVRDAFRNLVTAEGTRAVREWDDLLSVFDSELHSLSSRASAGPQGRSESRDPPKHGAPTKEAAPAQPAGDSSTRSSDSLAQNDRGSAAATEVLRELIDARLLTSYEVREDEHEPTRHVEIIHESLLANWPRLVRWQTQDVNAAQLRDELRQAASAWREHDRNDDLLWTGSAYREFTVWRERYPGGLTDVEEGFAEAMTSLATRRRRMRRFAVSAGFVTLLVVLLIVLGFWRRSELETSRAEAANFLTLGRAELDDYPTAALAYARKSLETADTPAGRRFAVEALWRGPSARVLPLETGERSGGGFYRLAISPDDQWLATSSHNGLVLLFPRNGGPSKVFHHPSRPGTRPLLFGPDSATLITEFEMIRVWSVPEGDLIRTIEAREREGMAWFWMVGDQFLTFAGPSAERSKWRVRSWPLTGGEPTNVGTWNAESVSHGDVDPTGTWVALVRNRKAYLRALAGFATASEMIVGPQDEEISEVYFSPRGDRLAFSTPLTNGSFRVLVWPLGQDSGAPLRVLEPVNPDVFFYPQFDPTGSLLAMGSGAERAVYLWDLNGPPDADPAILRRSDVDVVRHGVFGPDGQWLATVHESSISFWPLGCPRVRVLRGHEGNWIGMTFTADGRWLVSRDYPKGVRLWPLTSAVGTGQRIIGRGWSFAAHPTRQELLLATETRGPVVLMPLDGGPTRELFGEGESFLWGAAFDREGRLAAVASAFAEDPKNMLLRIVDLQTGEVQVLNQVGDTVGSRDKWDPMTGRVIQMEFTADGTLYSAGWGGVRLWDLETGKATAFHEAGRARMDISPDGRYLLVAGGERDVRWSELRLFDLENDTSREITTHGSSVSHLTFDPSSRVIVSGDAEGVVRIGPLTGEEPHLLLGHDGRVDGVAISPDGRWVFSSAGTEIRQWPMPDLSKPPLHTLPHAELIAKLDSFTNLRVVLDEESSTGWKLEIGPFPGWETVPTW